MRQQVHDQGEKAEAQGELECEDRAAGSDGDQPASPGPGPPDVLEAGPAPGNPLGHDVPPSRAGDRASEQHRITYSVLCTTKACGRMFQCPPNTAAAATRPALCSCSGASRAPQTPGADRARA